MNNTASTPPADGGSDVSSPPAQQQETTEFDWPPLESNPDVLTEYLHQIGLSDGFAIGEVYGFDEDLLALVPQPVYAVMVALERTKEKQHDDGDNDPGTTTTAEDDVVVSATQPPPFYMKQEGTLDNACGIIACLHAIYNQPSAAVDAMMAPHSVLAQFQTATADQTPHERGRALEQNQQFRTVHRAFAQQGQSAAILRDQDQVKYHYVAFVVWQGQLYELDGTRPQGPRRIESPQQPAGSSDIDVLRGAIAEIQKRLTAGQITERLSILTLNPSVDF